jgi:hypothetical protein
MGKQATLLLRWKMNVPETKAATDFFWKKEQKTKQSFKYVKDEGSRDSYLQILHVSNADNETQTDGKNFCLLPLKNQRKNSSFVLLAFLVLLSPASLFSSLFSFTMTKGSKKKNLYVPLLSVFSLPASVAFFFSVSLFAVFFFLPLTLRFSLIFLPSLFYFSALFLPPLARSLEGFIYSLTYLYLGKIQCINSRMQIHADVQ